ncbi:MAG: DMT family transporter [Pseudomonadota bacterium]
MRPGLIGLISVTMVAFAANSVLNRMAVDGQHIDPLTFAIIRVVSGAVMLSILALASGRRPRIPAPGRFLSAVALTSYLLGFSIAYVHLEAGIGALILFGGVQLVMFGAGVISDEVIPAQRWIGAGAAFGGLVLLCWPADAAAPWIGIVAMGLAAIGWAFYSLLGRGAKDPLADTAASFLIAAPLVWLPVLVLPVSPEGPMPVTGLGYGLAIVSGAVTSGLGYALWYRILPQIDASTAALVQLSAPFLAVLGGATLLGEAVGWRIAIAGALILGGIALGLAQRKIGSSGS